MYSAGALSTVHVESLESWRGVTLFFHRVAFTLLPPQSESTEQEIWTQSPKVLLSSPKLISKDSNRKGKSCNVQINIFDSLKKKGTKMIAFGNRRSCYCVLFSSMALIKMYRKQLKYISICFIQFEGRESDDLGGYAYSVLLFYFYHCVHYFKI